jgi:hypothetical protein
MKEPIANYRRRHRRPTVERVKSSSRAHHWRPEMVPSHSVVKKEQQCLQEAESIWPSQTSTDAPLRASCWAVSLPGKAIAPSANTVLSRRWCGQPNTSTGAHCLPSRTSRAPDVTGRPRSYTASATRAKACSHRYHLQGDSTAALKLGYRDW